MIEYIYSDDGEGGALFPQRPGCGMHHLPTQKIAAVGPHEVEKDQKAYKSKFQNPHSGGGISELRHEVCML